MVTDRLDLPRPTVTDVIAGISVALVLIPQSLAYAQISEMPVVVGLFAASLPLIGFSLFASSPYLQTGPVALTSLLTLAALQGAGFSSDNPEWVRLGALLALIVGVCRLALGLARLGWLAFLIAEPVRMGFTSAAAIVIMSSQLPKTLGTSLTAPQGSTIGQAAWSIGNPGRWSIGDLVLATVTLVVMLGGRRLHRLFPGVAVAVVVGLAYATVSDGGVLTVGDTTPIPQGFPTLSLALPWSEVSTLALGGLIIALVGFAEPASIARLFAKQDGSVWDANREFASSGFANLISSVSGAVPVGGSFSRSSINRLAGAKTRWSGGITGLVVFAFLPVASVLDRLPLAVLGAIVVGAVVGLVQPRALLGLWRRSRLEAALAWLTFVVTLVVTPAVHWAVLVGIGATVIAHVVRPFTLRPAPSSNGRVAVRSDGLLWLGSYRSFERQLRAAVEENPSADVIVDFGSEADPDQAVEIVIDRVAQEAPGRSITIAGNG